MKICSRLISLVIGIGWLALAAPARAQFDDAANAGPGVKLDKTVVVRIKIGMTITAVGGPCRGIVGTAPIPTEWPEQQVRVDKEDVSPNCKVEYRKLGATVRQMVVRVPSMQSGDSAHAFVTFECTRRTILPPDDKSKYKIPTKLDGDPAVAQYLNPSPSIESASDKIVHLAKEAAEGKKDWDEVEALYDSVREHLTFKEGPLKGALKGLNDGSGDCEEYSSLFIALCRAMKIPARTVWVPGHCYSEFYLVDDKGKGYWFPCQSAGARAFGGIPETRPILQKGDNFHDPDRPHDHLRYVSEMLRGQMKKGDGKPQVAFIREEVK
jgi:Transglutaminase-like superfamily